MPLFNSEVKLAISLPLVNTNYNEVLPLTPDFSLEFCRSAAPCGFFRLTLARPLLVKQTNKKKQDFKVIFGDPLPLCA